MIAWTHRPMWSPARPPWSWLHPGTGARRSRLAHALSSITTRNLAMFLAIFLIALAPLTYAYWQDVTDSRIAILAARLELIGEQSVKRIDPALVASLSARGDTGGAAHTVLVAVLNAIQSEFGVDNAVLLRRNGAGTFHFLADGEGQFFVTQPAFIHEQFPETRRAAVEAWERRSERHTQLFGFGTFEYLQLNTPIVNADGEVVAVLLLNKFAEDVDQAIKAETVRLLLLTMGLLVVGALVFRTFSTRLLRPLVVLQSAADRLAAGDLAVEIDPVKGRDEVARLNGSFRTMVRELRQSREELERRNAELQRTLARVRTMEAFEESLAKFVPRTVRSALHADPAALERDKTEKDVTVLFLDVEGSSTLTEAMEPQRIDRLIEDYFSQYLDFVHEYQGELTETAGDGLMIVFQGDDPSLHALNAVRTALAIQAATQRLCSNDPQLKDCLRINIGINSGAALVGFTRYEGALGTRVTFTAAGRTTIVAARLQQLARGGSVLLSAETARRIAARADFAALDAALDEQGTVTLKNLRQPERVYRLGPREGSPGPRVDIAAGAPTGEPAARRKA